MNRYGLIGFPLTHSFSKKFFLAKFETEGLQNCVYENFELSSINEFPTLLKSNSDLKGLNITIPYKQTIIPFLNELDETAKAVGAINTIAFQQNKLMGYNTDVIGFEKSFFPLVKHFHTHALVLGNGGATKAVCYFLKKIGMNYLIVSRKKMADTITYDELNDFYFRQFLVIINCTPVGMFPDVDSFPPLNYDLLTSKHLLFDLIYNPTETLFLQKGKANGATIKNGLEMLQLQAEAAWEIWNK